MIGLLRIMLMGVAVLWLAAEADAQRRIATVIGNGEYSQQGWDLPNAVSDAELLEKTLKEIGFEDVKLYRNLDEDALEEAFAEHADRLSAAGPRAIGLIYLRDMAWRSRGRIFLSRWMPVCALNRMSGKMRSRFGSGSTRSVERAMP